MDVRPGDVAAEEIDQGIDGPHDEASADTGRGRRSVDHPDAETSGDKTDGGTAGRRERRAGRLPKGAQIITGRDGETVVVVQSSVAHDILVLLVKVAVIILAFILVFTFLFGFFRVASTDMAPNVNDGDLVMFYRLDKTYVTGDLTLVAYQGQTQVRRVVASAGDCVLIDAEGLKVNGALQQEPKISQGQVTQPYEDGIHFTSTCPSGQPGVGVGEGQVFVLADARTNGVDSRIYGPVNITDTLGKINLILRLRQF